MRFCLSLFLGMVLLSCFVVVGSVAARFIGWELRGTELICPNNILLILLP
uniref:Uncharacterized protein n=1 Tax=Rhizophora mucronata TaxID=61149 RepID=A0A2P2QXH3_RHIMU